LGIPRHEVRNAIEKLKKGYGLAPSDNVKVDSDGNVVDPRTGEDIGNIHDEACNKR
jgi:hypothetical protein